MCDPLTIAGIALTVGSTAANYVGNQKAEAARNDVLAAERIRQNALDKEAEALNLTSQDRFQGFGEKQNERASSLADYFTGQQIAEPEPAAAMPISSSQLVVNEENKQRAKARDLTDRTGTALGELRSFGDLMGDTSRGQARDASLIGQIGGFKSGSSGVMPFELDQASKAGDGIKTFADLMGGFGSIGLTAGLSGGKLPTFGTKAPAVIPGIGSYTAATKASRLGSMY